MPTYEYECKSCEHRFEEFQSMTAKPLRTCPECKKKSLERLIGIGAGVLFKGGGFYETDYRSESYTKAAEADKKSAEPKSEAKSDTPSAPSTKPEKAEKKPKAEASPARAKKPPKKGE